MSVVRSSSRSRPTRVSARANGAPGSCGCRGRTQGAGGRSCAPGRTSSGSSNRRGSRLAAPLTTITVVPAASASSPTVVGTRDSRKSPLTGLSMRRHSSMKFGKQAAVVAEPPLDVGAVADHLQRGAQQPHGGFLSGREHIGGHPHDVSDLGHRPVREGRRRQAGQHVVTGLAPAVFDVGRENARRGYSSGVFVSVLVGVAQPAAWVPRASRSRLVAVLLGHAQQVGDDAQRERARETLDELALTRREEGRRGCRRRAATSRPRSP